jgi:hypothetical protein
MAKGKDKSSLKRLSPTEKWSDGEKVSSAALFETPKGKQGISVRLGKKTGDYEQYGKSIWIDEDLNFSSWLKWFLKTVKKSYFKLFGKVLTLDEEIESYKSKKEELTKQLVGLQIKLELAEKREQEYKKIVELAKETKGKFKRDFDKTHLEFIELIQESLNNETGKEEEIKRKIKNDPWLLGLECFVEAKNEDVDKQAEIDLHIKTRYNKDFIFEIKSPNKKPFVRKDKNKKRRYVISPELSEALSEIIVYLRKTDIYSDKASEGVYGIQKAEGIILMGASLEEEEMKILKEINFHFYPHVQIITYEDLNVRITREIEMLNSILKDERSKMRDGGGKNGN